MKRSSAPSATLASGKRPCFVTPFRTASAATAAAHDGVQAKVSEPPLVRPTTVAAAAAACASSCQTDVEPTTLASTQQRSKTFVTPRSIGCTSEVRRYDSQAVSKLMHLPSTRVADGAKESLRQEQKHLPKQQEQQPCQQQTPQYFNVVWGKLSKKKHKTWEGDAVLIIQGRSLTLMDMEGKEIGRGVPQRQGAEPLTEGRTLLVGGKEVEITSCIDAKVFASGACFNSTSVKGLKEIGNHTAESGAKAFRLPLSRNPKDAREDVRAAPGCEAVKPRHDPEASGALVLPKPGRTDQPTSATLGSHLVDVVVDPHIGRHLRPHQREGVTFLYECVMGMRDCNGRGAILADEMGLGKTLQVIALIWTLLKQGPYGGKPVVKRVLVVTPGSLVKNWNREFRKWLGTERLSVYCVDSDNKAKEFATMPLCPVMIISYEMLLRYIDDVRRVKFGLLVCDEGHRLKNSNIKTTSLLAQLEVQRRIILTGTPVQNDLQEFFALADFCNPDILGSSSSFRRLYELPIIESKQPGCSSDAASLGAERAAELARLTSAFVLRRTSELNQAYLPSRVEYTVFCRPSDEQDRRYRSQVRDFAASCTEWLSPDSSQHLLWISNLRKLCNHPALLLTCGRDSRRSSSEEEEERAAAVGPDRRTCAEDLGDVVAAGRRTEGTQCAAATATPANRTPDGRAAAAFAAVDIEVVAIPESLAFEHSGKCAAVERMLAAMHRECSGDRIILVSNYTKTLDMLARLCDHHGYRYSRLDGQTPTAQRQQIVESFNDARSCRNTVFLLSSKAGGVGLNLIGANRLILFDIDWNPANDLQAMARVWRDGQKKRVHIYRLLTAGTIEEKMYQRQVSKLTIGGTITGDATGRCSRSAAMNFSSEELKDLFSYRGREETDCDTHDLLDCDCCDDCVVADRALGLACDQPRDRRLLPKPVVDLSSSDVKSWQHVHGHDVVNTVEDKLLQAAADFVSFVFINRQSPAFDKVTVPSGT